MQRGGQARDKLSKILTDPSYDEHDLADFIYEDHSSLDIDFSVEGYDFLLKSVQGGNLGMVDMVLRKIKDDCGLNLDLKKKIVNTRDDDDLSLLDHAKSKRMRKFLMKNGVTPDVVTPIANMLSTPDLSGKVAIDKLKTKKNVTFLGVNNASQESSIRPNYFIALEEGVVADISFRDGYDPKDTMKFFKAVANNRVDEALLLLDNAKIDVLNKMGSYCLMAASAFNSNLLLEKLINLGADVSMASKDGHSALHIACREGHYDMAKKLIVAGAVVNLGNIDIEGRKPFDYIKNDAIKQQMIEWCNRYFPSHSPSPSIEPNNAASVSQVQKGNARN